MKHLKIYTTHEEFESAVKEAPYVILDGDHIHYSGSVVDDLYVDLGLPSGKKWAKYNLGANSETEYGDYYMWGSVTPDTNNTCNWSTAPFNNGSSDYNEAYYASVSGDVYSNGVLAEKYDAVYQATNGVAHIPTNADFTELIENTTSEWVMDYQGSGVDGLLLTSTINGNSIFIPASGSRMDSSVNGQGMVAFLWSSSYLVGEQYVATVYYFMQDYSDSSASERCNGLSIRGIKD